MLGDDIAQLPGFAVAAHERDLGPVSALRRLADDLAEQRHPLSGLTAGAGPFLRTVASSPALLARAHEMVFGLEQVLATALTEAPDPPADPRLLAALVVAAYRAVLTETTRQVMNGTPLPQAAADHQRRLREAFVMLEAAVAAESQPPR